MENLIEGYKLKDRKYERAAIELVKVETGGASFNATTFKELDSDFDGKLDFQKGSMCEEVYKAAGVLDLWFEPVYQDPKPEAWYDERQMISYLKQRNYCDEIANELGMLMTKHYNLAYKKGYEHGCMSLTKRNI